MSETIPHHFISKESGEMDDYSYRNDFNAYLKDTLQNLEKLRENNSENNKKTDNFIKEIEMTNRSNRLYSNEYQHSQTNDEFNIEDNNMINQNSFSKYNVNSNINSGYQGSSINLNSTWSNLNGVGGNSIKLNQFKIGGNSIEDLTSENKEFSKEIDYLKEQIADNNIKIKFMNDNDLKEFDETDFKVYKTLSLLEDPKLSQVDRAKAISALIKG